MKTNSRKRLLVSSVAMLLVAMIALGTATFAWFTSSTTATAEGINIHTAKASTLQISGGDTTKDKQKWGTGVDYEFTKLLIPASAALVNLTNNSDITSNLSVEKWYETVAEKQTSYAAAAGKAKEITNLGSYVFKNQLNIRNTGSAAVNNVTVTVSGFDDAKYSYARIALVEATDRGTAVTAKADGLKLLAAQEKNDEVFKAATGLKATSVEGATGNDLTLVNQTINVTPAEGKLTFNVADSLEAKKGDGESAVYDTKYFNLYIWFEGEDEDCYSTNAVDISNLQFEVSGTTVDQIN